MSLPRWAPRLLTALLAAGLLAPVSSEAQQEGGCTVLCSPELKFEPTLTVENLLVPPRVVQLEDGAPADTVQLDRETAFEMIFALDAALAAFNALPEGSWLRNVEVEGSLDYVATGLPEAGDEVPAGEQRFLDDASPWSFSTLLVVPVAPLDP